MKEILKSWRRFEKSIIAEASERIFVASPSGEVVEVVHAMANWYQAGVEARAAQRDAGEGTYQGGEQRRVRVSPEPGRNLPRTISGGPMPPPTPDVAQQFPDVTPMTPMIRSGEVDLYLSQNNPVLLDKVTQRAIEFKIDQNSGTLLSIEEYSSDMLRDPEADPVDSGPKQKRQGRRRRQPRQLSSGMVDAKKVDSLVRTDTSRAMTPEQRKQLLVHIRKQLEITKAWKDSALDLVRGAHGDLMDIEGELAIAAAEQDAKEQAELRKKAGTRAKFWRKKIFNWVKNKWVYRPAFMGGLGHEYGLWPKAKAKLDTRPKWLRLGFQSKEEWKTQAYKLKNLRGPFGPTENPMSVFFQEKPAPGRFGLSGVELKIGEGKRGNSIGDVVDLMKRRGDVEEAEELEELRQDHENKLREVQETQGREKTFRDIRVPDQSNPGRTRPLNDGEIALLSQGELEIWDDRPGRHGETWNPGRAELDDPLPRDRQFYTVDDLLQIEEKIKFHLEGYEEVVDRRDKHPRNPDKPLDDDDAPDKRKKTKASPLDPDFKQTTLADSLRSVRKMVAISGLAAALLLWAQLAKAQGRRRNEGKDPFDAEALKEYALITVEYGIGVIPVVGDFWDFFLGIWDIIASENPKLASRIAGRATGEFFGILPPTQTGGSGADRALNWLMKDPLFLEYIKDPKQAHLWDHPIVRQQLAADKARQPPKAEHVDRYLRTTREDVLVPRHDLGLSSADEYPEKFKNIIIHGDRAIKVDGQYVLKPEYWGMSPDNPALRRSPGLNESFQRSKIKILIK